MASGDGVRNDLRELWFWQVLLVDWVAYLSALLLGLTKNLVSQHQGVMLMPARHDQSERTLCRHYILQQLFP